LEGPALINTVMTGAILLPMAVAAWLSSTPPAERVFASAALAAGLIVPVVVAVARVRRLLAAGHDRGELVAILEARPVRARGERRLRFWRGAPGRWLFRVAGLGFERTTPVVTVLHSSETPA